MFALRRYRDFRIGVFYFGSSYMYIGIKLSLSSSLLIYCWAFT